MSDDKTSDAGAARGERPGTLVTPDTAPEAITQADREAAAKVLGGLAPVDLLAGRQDSLSLVQAFARHRRLNSHSAGEGLREAIEALEPFADALGDDDADEPDHTEATVVCGRSTDYSLDLGDFRAARRALAILNDNPPSDAGSTTPSGGEGVRACQVPPPGWRCTRAASHDGPCAAIPDGDLQDEIADALDDSLDMDWTGRVGARAVMALLRSKGMVS